MLWKLLDGTMTVEFTSASPEELLEAITQAGIDLYGVKQTDELTCRIGVRRRDFGRISGLLRRRGGKYQVLQRKGLFWPLKAFWHRPVLLGCFLLLLFLSFYLPTRVLFVSVEGNHNIPARLILRAAEDCGIRFGASRKQVRSEQVKNRLLSAVPDLQWAGVNTRGCTAVISVREGMEEEKKEQTNVVSSLIAERDGFILSATVTRGTALVTPGESVTRGQVLISGFTDCDFCIRAARAEGEILAQTNRNLKAVTPQTYTALEACNDAAWKISLLIGKKRINLWKDSRISDTSCGRMYAEYYVSLPGGFRLPLGISVDRYQNYAVTEAGLSGTDASVLLQQFSDDYTKQQMIAGEILRKQQKLLLSESLYQLNSSYMCREIIGRERREQIGDKNEQGN